MEKRFTFGAVSPNFAMIKDNGEPMDTEEVVDKLNEQQSTITKLEQICETKMQEIEDIKYGLKEIAYKYRKEVQFKADTDPNQAVKEVLGEQQAIIKSKDKQLERLYNYFQDYLKDEMSGNAFSEMWDFVKEEECWEDE